MDPNESESCTKIADEQSQQQQQQQKRQQQQYGIHERNEVVPSSETSIGDDNELTTTITTKHKQQTVSVDGPSNGTLKKPTIEKQFRNSDDAQDSDDGSCISRLRYDSDTDDSESHLIIQSENEQTDSQTASVRPTTTIKENGGTASMKQLANKHKSSDTTAEPYESDDSDFDDDDISADGEQFNGFSMVDVNSSKGLFRFIFDFIISPLFVLVSFQNFE